MRNALFVLGALLVIGGILIAGGMLKYKDTDTVADFGRVEIEASREKTTPVNWGWILLGGGAVALVAGAMMRRP